MKNIIKPIEKQLDKEQAQAAALLLLAISVACLWGIALCGKASKQVGDMHVALHFDGGQNMLRDINIRGGAYK